jgi:hypothetical protein
VPTSGQAINYVSVDEVAASFEAAHFGEEAIEENPGRTEASSCFGTTNPSGTSPITCRPGVPLTVIAYTGSWVFCRSRADR